MFRRDTYIFPFTYDSFGRRIEKDLTTVIDSVTKTSSWIYVYDDDNIALEVYTDPTGTVGKNFYTHGVGADEHLALERSGSYYYYYADGLGSVTAITDANKNVVQSYSYDSFGTPKKSTSFRNSYSYTGREWDKETGLYHYRARYYDPTEGRFVSKDPASFGGGDVNLYGYVQNNPFNWTDPWGLTWIKPNFPTDGCPAGSNCVDPGPQTIPVDDSKSFIPSPYPETRIPPNALPPADWVAEAMKKLFPPKVDNKQPVKKPCFNNYH